MAEIKTKPETSEGIGNFLVPLAIVISAILVSVSIIYSGSTKPKADPTDNTATLGETDSSTDETDTPTAAEPGTKLREFETFTEYDTELCEENGKPIVYLFSTTWCPHCEWVKDTFDSWAKENSDKIVAYHWELDINDNTITDAVETEVPAEHTQVFNLFNPDGSVPTYVFGCRFRRIGNGFESESDLEKERQTFDKVLNELL